MSTYTEAMRRGWEMVEHRQAFDAWFRGKDQATVSRNSSEIWSACAMGCAWLGGFVLKAEGPYGQCPECSGTYLLTAHLNDVHRWSVDRIADYLEEVAS